VTPAGDTDYEAAGHRYAAVRRPDPRIAARVHAALGDARTVINVGAGAGSYEPLDRHVVAVEPSAVMRAQRAPYLAPAVDAVAEQLPFDDDSFDAAMATITVHQWAFPDRGLAELRRVSRGPVVVLTIDPDAIGQFWLSEYVPAVGAAEARRMPPVENLQAALGGMVRVETVPVPLDCTDGFAEAFYGRPESFLDPHVRAAQSSWAFVEPAVAEAGLERLRDDLASGAWDARFGALRTQPELHGALTLVVAWP
jgi:hypothetical protein